MSNIGGMNRFFSWAGKAAPRDFPRAKPEENSEESVWDRCGAIEEECLLERCGC